MQTDAGVTKLIHIHPYPARFWEEHVNVNSSVVIIIFRLFKDNYV